MIAVLIGCGLRRAEAAALKLEDFQLRDGRWVIADLNGKGGHIRTVPMPDWVKKAIDEWTVSRWTHFRPTFQSHQQGGPDVGKWIHAKGDLVDR
jgi:integrase